MDFKFFLWQTLNVLADVFTVLIFLRVIFSWIRSEAFGLNRFIFRSTEPLLAPIRRVIPHLGNFDISPLVALVLIDIIRSVANNIL